MKERADVPAGEQAGMGADDFSPELFEEIGARATRPARPARQRTGTPIQPEVLQELPLQARAIAHLSQYERARYRRACALLATGGGPRSLILGGVPLTGLGVYEALLTRSWAARIADPREMVHLAEVAVEIAASLDPRGYGTKHIADLRARALGELANAYRASDWLRSASRTLGEAHFWLIAGTGDLYLRARLFELDACLLGRRREFHLALPQLKDVSEIYRDLGESHLAGRALISLALYTSYGGNNEHAIELNAKGLTLIDRERDPVLLQMALHNHILFLADLKQFKKAERVLFLSRRHFLYRRGIGALRFRGLEGRINYGLGRLVSAEIALREVKQGLAHLELSFYGALVCLELAMVLVSQGRVEEAEKEVLAAREVFLGLEICREFLGSVIYLEECFRRGTATPELIEVTVGYLRRRELEVRPEDLR